MGWFADRPIVSARLAAGDVRTGLVISDLSGRSVHRHGLWSLGTGRGGAHGLAEPATGSLVVRVGCGNDTEWLCQRRNQRFFPQTCGLAFVMAAFALRGGEMSIRRVIPVANIASGRGTGIGTLRAAIPLAVCLSAAFYCYPEICPFVAVVMLISYLLPWAAGAAQWRARMGSFGCMTLITVVLSSPEAGRAVRALRNQASVITGFPVAWSPGGFLAHSLGGRSGPAEGGKWFYEDAWVPLIIGMPIMLCFLFLLNRAERRWSANFAGRGIASRPVCRWLALVPFFAMATVCAAASLYFRWFVPNPWPQADGAVGQTFSQYKLALWTSPALLTLAATGIIRLAGRRHFLAVGGLAIWCALGIGQVNGMLLAWANPIFWASGEKQEPFESYRVFCETLSKRPASESFYLAASADDLASMVQRKLLAYFLQDRELPGNWLVDKSIPLRQMGVENHDLEQEADWLVRYHAIDSTELGTLPRLCRLTVARKHPTKWPPPQITGGYHREIGLDGRWFFWTAHELQIVWSQRAAGDDDPPPPPARVRLSFAVRSLAAAQEITIQIVVGGNPVATSTVPADMKETSVVSEPFFYRGQRGEGPFHRLCRAGPSVGKRSARNFVPSDCGVAGTCAKLIARPAQFV